MEEVDEITQDIILRFLRDNYPVTKLRDKRRFKRGIRLHEYHPDEKGHGFLKPRVELNKTFNALSETLSDVFGISQYEINVAILRYLDLL
jgi:hypothetical protein